MGETSTGKAQISWREPEMGAGVSPVVCSCRIDVQTGQRTEIIDLTDQCDELVARSRLAEGFLQLLGAYDLHAGGQRERAGFHEDLAGSLERIAPQDRYWAHDDLTRRRENLEEKLRPNGFSHVRAARRGIRLWPCSSSRVVWLWVGGSGCCSSSSTVGDDAG